MVLTVLTVRRTRFTRLLLMERSRFLLVVTLTALLLVGAAPDQTMLALLVARLAVAAALEDTLKRVIALQRGHMQSLLVLVERQIPISQICKTALFLALVIFLLFPVVVTAQV